MNALKVIFEFANKNGLKVWDKSNFNQLDNEIILSKGGKIISRLYNNGNDEIDKVVKFKNDYIIFIPVLKIKLDGCSKPIIIGNNKLFQIIDYIGCSELNIISKKTNAIEILEKESKIQLINLIDIKQKSVFKKWIPAWIELYETFVNKFEDCNFSDKLNFHLLNEALIKNTILISAITIKIKNVQCIYEINISTFPVNFKMGYYYNNKFIERFNSGDGESLHFSPTYFIRIFNEDVKIYDYSIKILDFTFY